MMPRYRKFWNRKWGSLVAMVTLYLCVCVMVVSYQIIAKMLVYIHVVESEELDPISVVSNKRQYMGLQRNHYENLKFPRGDLRLQFKELSPVPHDIAYDNADIFPCIQNERDRRDPNITEDLWCLERPEFQPQYKNPCYFTTDKGWYEDTICLPYFHILGADKCGTTDFHHKLSQHPQILHHVGNLGKESYYWCWLRYGVWMLTSIRRWKWFQYIRHYFSHAAQQIVSAYIETGDQLIAGDATPMDLWDFRGWRRDPHNAGLEEPEVLTPHLMRHMYRDPSFLVLMRDPVQRLYSDYVFMAWNTVVTSQNFARDAPIAVRVMRDCLAVNSTRQCFFSDDVYRRMPARLHIGCYSIFLREWLSVFHRRNFFFLRTEDWRDNTTRALQKAFEFLEVDPVSETELEKMASSDIINRTENKKKLGDMLPETRALLTEFYAPFNEDLAKLLGDDRFLWKERQK